MALCRMPDSYTKTDLAPTVSQIRIGISMTVISFKSQKTIKDYEGSTFAGLKAQRLTLWAFWGTDDTLCPVNRCSAS